MYNIDPQSATPIYEQIVSQAEKLIQTGALAEGAQFPSVRLVSIKHAVNSRTVLKAYFILREKGVIRAEGTRGYFVCGDAVEKIKSGGLYALAGLKDEIKRAVIAGVSKSAALQCVEAAYENAENKEDKA